MKNLIIILFFTLTILKVDSQTLELWSESAIVIDQETEQILFEKNKNLIIPPASMTKLVTLYMVYLEIESGNIFRDDIVPISKRADYKNLPRDSSLMFIEEGQNVTLLELMKGLAIPSGNDAAIAIAEYLYGSVEEYLLKVNKKMVDLGLTSLIFVDSSGFDDNNTITTSQFVEFCLILLKRFPIILDELFSEQSFIYPKSHNGRTTIGQIKQYNHNPIIDIYPGCDGLKTGFINKSGMNISLTASNKNRRVIAVLAGVKDSDKKIAEKKRVYDSITILNYSLNNFINIHLDKIVLPYIKISNELIKPVIPYKRLFTLFNNSSFSYELFSDIDIFNFGETIGFVHINNGINSFKYPIIINKYFNIKD